MKKLLLLIGILILALGCSSEPEIVYKEIIVTATPLPEATAIPTPLPANTPVPTATSIPPTPTSTNTPTPTTTTTPIPTATFTAIKKYRLELAKAYKEASEKIPPTSSGSVGYSGLSSLLCGAMIIAEDGEYLGIISSNSYSSDSIMNEYGEYGSKYNSNSVFNPYSFNPPTIIGNKAILGYLTTNDFKSGAIHPIVLKGWLLQGNCPYN